MQPRPSAETSGPFFPRQRYFINHLSEAPAQNDLSSKCRITKCKALYSAIDLIGTRGFDELRNPIGARPSKKDRLLQGVRYNWTLLCLLN
jgi:hypothetical protein